MPQACYDAIVLGAGGVGSAAMWQLARRGLRVLGIDRFTPPHERGSSHGQTRIIRQAYFEHPDYVPLLLDSYRLWEELEQLVGQTLKVECGLVEIGPADGAVVPGVLEAARQHRLAVDALDRSAIEQCWPALRLPDGLAGVFEPRAGFLHVERCVAACLSQARACGADLLTEATVHGWSTGSDVVVQTSAGDFSCSRLIVAAGAWAGQLLAPLGVPLTVRRKMLMWHRPQDRATHIASGFPCFLFELSRGVFYGFPAIDDQGLKAAEHSGGELVSDPLRVDRELHEADRAPVESFLQACLPSVATPCTSHTVCLYTVSPDEHFLVDLHPEDRRIALAAGLSGHGFKFAPVLGRALAELAIDGTTALPIRFLGLDRFGRPAAHGQ